jgi:hypothetical protein
VPEKVFCANMLALPSLDLDFPEVLGQVGHGDLYDKYPQRR